MKKTTRHVKKEILASLSIEDKLQETILQKIRQLIFKNRINDMKVLAEASKILFPKKGEVALYSIIFEAFWDKRQYKEALQAYQRANKPFWHAEEVAQYYQRKGLLKKAMAEYEHLVNAYFKMGKDFLPLPGGPVALFKLGQWYAKRNPNKAKKYLTLYLQAEKLKQDAKNLKHKNAARAILNEICYMNKKRG